MHSPEDIERFRDEMVRHQTKLNQKSTETESSKAEDDSKTSSSPVDSTNNKLSSETDGLTDKKESPVVANGCNSDAVKGAAKLVDEEIVR